MQIHQLVDACLFAFSFWLACQLRGSQLIIESLKLDPVQPFGEFIWFYLGIIVVAPLILESQGFYDRPQLGSRAPALWSLFRGCFFTTLGLIIVLFYIRRYLARSIPIWFGFISFTLLYLKHELVRLGYQSRLRQPQYFRRFVLIGSSEETSSMREELRDRSETNIQIVAELDLGKTSVESLVHLLHDQSVNGVILGARHTYFEQVEAVIRACEMEGVEAWVVADFFRTQISRPSFDDFYGRPVLVFRTTPEASWQGVLKQLIDYAGALLLLLLLTVIPVIPLAALLIKLTSRGPVFFRQSRSGLNGSPFTMYKFRTMVTNAEQLKHELESMNEMRGPVFKVTKDPRITSVGKLLRRYSIDELPQLLNVLRGEMSLVGPRPLPVNEVKRFNDLSHRRRLSVKPGLTCLWQISGRNQIVEFKDWVRLDLEYIDNWSLWLDLKILMRTIPAVFLGTGAK